MTMKPGPAWLVLGLAIVILVAALLTRDNSGDAHASTTPDAATTTGLETPGTTLNRPSTTGPPSTTSTTLPAGVEPNEVGWVLVMEYHIVEAGVDEDGFWHTPATIRRQLEWLHDNDFYPVTVADLTSHSIDVPAGKIPVALTFDDSSSGQYRILEDGTVDPDSAMGVLMDFAEENPDFPAVATWNVLFAVSPATSLFGQPEYEQEKLETIVDLGGEIASHTLSHADLAEADAAGVQRELAEATAAIVERLPGYDVRSLSVPFGNFPTDPSLVVKGSYEGMTYEHTGVMRNGGDLSVSPFSTQWDPYMIDRAIPEPGYFERAIVDTVEDHPDLLFVSDGDPDVITVPEEDHLPQELQGTFRPSEWGAFEVHRY